MMTHRILVADDDAEWHELVRSYLNDPAYQLTFVGTGEKALESAAQNPPDVALIDIRLPDLTGQELCRRLRALPGLERIPIVVLSGYRQEKVPSLEIGADSFVSKDTAKSDLRPTLQALLRRVQMDLGILTRDDMRLDPRENTVHHREKLIATLTRKEFLFFYTLVRRAPSPVSRDEMSSVLDSHDELDPASRALDMLATRTRQRLGASLGERIRSSRKIGWVYDPSAAHAKKLATRPQRAADGRR